MPTFNGFTVCSVVTATCKCIYKKVIDALRTHVISNIVDSFQRKEVRFLPRDVQKSRSPGIRHPTPPDGRDPGGGGLQVL